MKNAILVNLNRCTGCWTCSMACKVAHDLETDEFWINIRTIGGGEIDEPSGVWPNLYLNWKPIYGSGCISCTGDALTDNKPFCAFNCPTGALTYGDLDDDSSAASLRLAELKAIGFSQTELPIWENTHKNIIYLERPKV